MREKRKGGGWMKGRPYDAAEYALVLVLVQVLVRAPASAHSAWSHVRPSTLLLAVVGCLGAASSRLVSSLGRTRPSPSSLLTLSS